MSEEFDVRTPLSKRLKKKLSGVEQQKAAENAVTAAVGDLAAWKAIYKLCIELRNFEISQLVQRNNFFMIFQGVLLAGICQSAGQIPIVSFMICVAGLGISLLQACMAAGAKYWQVHWEINTQRSEQAMTKITQYHRILRWQLNRHGVNIDKDLEAKLENRALLVHLFEEESNNDRVRRSVKESRPYAFFTNKFIMRKFSSSRIPIYAGFFLAMIWFVLLICTVRFEGLSTGVFDFIVGFQARKTI
ncbi:hypothetical protein [Pseudomonas atacamensis]|uniref:RipA family octameric membrane protein n=1 Tax=Pseudomonas atacamensis TaxID=2565368 RepID=UPI000D925A95|nr:hypothetical protein DMX04_00410 [Pseudomonas koreensis]